MIERTINYFHNYASNDKPGKLFHVIINGLLFIIITLLFAVVPLILEKGYEYFPMFTPPYNYYLSLPMIGLGICLIIWTNTIFIKNRGTSVPVSPPKGLIDAGPYKYSRHPMTWAVCLLLFGIGIFYNSFLSVLVFCPLYTLINYYEIKYIEEPELERRFGEKYLLYKKKVPMVF